MELNVVDQEKKKRLFYARLGGIIISAVIFIMLICFYLNIFDEWIMSVSVMFLSAIGFNINALFLSTKENNNVANASLGFAALLFLMGLGLLIYGLLTGNLILI